VLNPLFLVFLSALIIISIINPMGAVSEAVVHDPYTQDAFFKGFTEGYNTMDALASLAFGVLVIDTLKGLGITERKDIALSTVKAGFVSVLLMVVIYSCLSYMGAMSVGQLTLSENGGIALAQTARHYFGSLGSILLALIVTLACLKTAIGLITACAEAFVEMFPDSFSYRKYVLIFTLLGCGIANIGLTQIIQLSIPVLMFLYPLAMILILLSLFSQFFTGNRIIYITTTIATAIFSIGDALAAMPESIRSITLADRALNLYSKMPFFQFGMAWVLPAAAGFLIGLAVYSLHSMKTRLH